MTLPGILISITAVTLVVALPIAVARAGTRAGERRPWRVIIAVLVPALLLAASGLLAANGTLSRLDRLPPPVGLLLIGCLLATVGLALSPIGGVMARGLPLAGLIGFQAFRVFAELSIDLAHRHGIAPAQLTWHGRNLDLVTALTAIPVALLVRAGTRPRLAIAWNLMGIALLINVMTVGMLSLPAPWQRMWPSNIWVTWFPYVWLPAILVMAALFGHLVALRALLTRRVN